MRTIEFYEQCGQFDRALSSEPSVVEIPDELYTHMAVYRSDIFKMKQLTGEVTTEIIEIKNSDFDTANYYVTVEDWEWATNRIYARDNYTLKAPLTGKFELPDDCKDWGVGDIILYRNLNNKKLPGMWKSCWMRLYFVATHLFFASKAWNNWKNENTPKYEFKLIPASKRKNKKEDWKTQQVMVKKVQYVFDNCNHITYNGYEIINVMLEQDA